MCKSTIVMQQYNEIQSIINHYVRFGVIYRKKYQEQYNKLGKVQSLFCLEEHLPALNWIGITILSGIIGNASWDLVKLVCRKIAQQVKSPQIDESIYNEEIFEEFRCFIEEYHYNSQKINHEVEKAINSEQETSGFTEQDSEDIINAKSSEARIEILKRCMHVSKIKKGQRISAEVLNKCWDKFTG